VRVRSRDPESNTDFTRTVVENGRAMGTQAEFDQMIKSGADRVPNEMTPTI